MGKNIHEIRDPIHIFVRLDNYEREILNSLYFQRLRHIHQLALTYLIYPGATHKRFEHSLGVMELAGRVYDIVTSPDNVSDNIRDLFAELNNGDAKAYWRRVIRMAALCHDIGHLPFSHAAEKDLLPDGWDHEKLTMELICSDAMKSIWNSITPPMRFEDVVKLAVGPKKAKGYQFTDWQTILSEIIVGDAFGVDRMDYLLRDSHHAGVAYGRFDHYRLIDTIRILPLPSEHDQNGTGEPSLGVDEGGIQSAEALMLARYFMYSQMYFHPIRRIYDIHLKDFLKEWLDNGFFSTNISDHAKMTDNEVTSALWRAAYDENAKGHRHARRIVRREHFKDIYERNPSDVKINPEAGSAVYEALQNEFGVEYFRHDRYNQKSGAPDFPVRLRDGNRIVSSLSLSETLMHLPVVSIDYVFSDRTIVDKAQRWLKLKRNDILKRCEEVDNG